MANVTYFVVLPFVRDESGELVAEEGVEAQSAITAQRRAQAMLAKKAGAVAFSRIGAALSPFSAFLLLQGIETLPLRIERHSQNAAAVAAWLAKRPEVRNVIHPSLQTGEPRRRADTYLEGGYGGLVGFELAGGRAAGRKFIDSLKLLYHVANIGDSRSLAIHPASTTHSQLSVEDQKATGVSDGYIRLSIGIEHIDDILVDLDSALAASRLQAAA